MAKRKDETFTLNGVMENQNKACGEGTVGLGSRLKRDPPRLPTGVFAVDYATGGGLPIYGSTCFWGKESGGKTSLALNTVSMAQKICWSCFRILEFCECSTPAVSMKVYWADVEGTLDRDWAEMLGVSSEEYYVGLADYGEQHVNIADAALKADDCGLVVVDSLAAMVPEVEMDAASEQQFIGKQPAMIGRMVRKLKQRLIRERKNGHPCTLLFTNQLRIKIGQMFGDPESMPGGKGMMHEFSLLLRCVQKALARDGADKKFADDRKKKKDFGQRHSISVKKAKVLTLAGVGEFVRCTHDLPDYGLRAGQVDDYNVALNYAKEYGIVRKDGKGWRYFDYKARTLEDIKSVWAKSPNQHLRTKQEIIERAKERLRGD